MNVLIFDKRNFFKWIVWFLLGVFLLFSVGCSVVKTTGNVLQGAGSVTWGTAKVAGKVAQVTSKAAWETGKATHKGIRTVVYIAKGKQIVPLEKQGNALYADVRLNRRVNAKFLVDTGASSMQISSAMASRLGINLSRAEPTQVGLAGGFVVRAYRVILNEVRLGGVRVKNVEAIVIPDDNMDLTDGLIGMTFLNHFDFQVNPQKPELVLQQKAI